MTYADVWEFWLRYREVGAEVDFVTVHFLPYWEDVPPRAEDAAAHVDHVRRQVAAAFPGKEILIGETGWPSNGRMREGALASRINQARFVSEILDRARRDNFRVNLFEAYDEPWKRRWEGTVGGYWGLLDGTERKLKYPAGAEISNYPFWKLQMACGLMLCIGVFGAALLTLRRSPSSPRPASWVAVAICATLSGILLGIGADKMLHESYGVGGWLIQGLLLAAGVAAPLLSANALMTERPLPTFLEILGPPEVRSWPLTTRLLGFALIVTTVIAVATALSLVFDARWRDFPFAALTMAVVPFCTVAFLNPAKSGPRPIAEMVFAGLFALTVPYIAFNEGPHNWQSLWTCAAYLALGVALWRPRTVAVAETADIATSAPSSVRPPRHRNPREKSSAGHGRTGWWREGDGKFEQRTERAANSLLLAIVIAGGQAPWTSEASLRDEEAELHSRVFVDEQHGGMIGGIFFLDDVGRYGLPHAVLQVLPLVRAILSNPETGLEYIAVVAAGFPGNTQPLPRGRVHFLLVEPFVVLHRRIVRVNTKG